MSVRPVSVEEMKEILRTVMSKDNKILMAAAAAIQCIEEFVHEGSTHSTSVALPSSRSCSDEDE